MLLLFLELGSELVLMRLLLDVSLVSEPERLRLEVVLVLQPELLMLRVFLLDLDTVGLLFTSGLPWPRGGLPRARLRVLSTSVVRLVVRLVVRQFGWWCWSRSVTLVSLVSEGDSGLAHPLSESAARCRRRWSR